jgi:hypothetical protein
VEIVGVEATGGTDGGFVIRTNGMGTEVVGFTVVAETEGSDSIGAGDMGIVGVGATERRGVAIRHSLYLIPPASQDSSVTMVTLGITCVVVSNDPAAKNADSLQVYRTFWTPYCF